MQRLLSEQVWLHEFCCSRPACPPKIAVFSAAFEMPILYTDGNSTDTGAPTPQQRGDRSDKMKHSKKERHRPLRQSRCEVLQEQRQELSAP
ncbi:hypothetical protein MRX96_049265 [Rhipicephalus microplus]